MKFVTKTVNNGRNDAGDLKGFEAPIAEFDSVADALETVGETTALALINQQADIKCRAVHRDSDKAGNGAADSERVTTYLKGVGTASNRSALGVPAAEANKVHKLAGVRFAKGDLEGAQKLVDAFTADPKACLEGLYADGTLRKGKPRTKAAE